MRQCRVRLGRGRRACRSCSAARREVTLRGRIHRRTPSPCAARAMSEWPHGEAARPAMARLRARVAGPGSAQKAESMIKGRLDSRLQQNFEECGIFGRRVAGVTQLVKDSVLERGVMPAPIQIAKDEEGRPRIRRGAGRAYSFALKPDDRANGGDELRRGVAQRICQNPGDFWRFVDHGAPRKSDDHRAPIFAKSRPRCGRSPRATHA